MKNKILKSFICLIAVVGIFCGGITATAAAPKPSAKNEITSNVIVLRDGDPYAVKQKIINIEETDIINNHTYEFDTALPKETNYYISGNLKLTKVNTLIVKSVLTVRSGVCVTFNSDKIKIGRSGNSYDENAEFNFNFELGKEYSIVVYSTTTSLSLWVDGAEIVKDYSLPEDYRDKAVSLSLGFSKGKGHFKNVRIWANDIVSEKEEMKFGEEIILNEQADTNTEINAETKVPTSTKADAEEKEPFDWITYGSVGLAALSVVLVAVYIVIKQRRLRNEK